MFLNHVAALLFMHEGPYVNSNSGNSPSVPSSLDQINENLTLYFLSASKAFTGRYRFYLNTDDVNKAMIPIARYSTLSVDAQNLSRVVAIAGSFGALITTFVLVFLVIVLRRSFIEGGSGKKIILLH
ncbi:hypothetical protein BDQ17DRAFT_1428523 [Cyathus striatus]|nr:hypothetical protein BDQ17DRAFT_1428523 [Cyathus striatus]